MVELTTEAFEAATQRGRRRLAGPRAESAHYDAERDRVVIKLMTGVEISFPPRAAQGLQDASPDDLAEIEVDAFGLGIHFPRLDADLYLPALVRGVAGSRVWMAAHLYRREDKARSRPHRPVKATKTA